MRRILRFAGVLAFGIGLLSGHSTGAGEAKKKIVFVAAAGSHGFGNHAYKAGFILFAKLLNENAPNVEATVVTGGWPKDPSAFDGAAAIVLGSDGGALPAQRTKELDALAKKGVGLACIHYTLDVPKGDVRRFMLDAIGGYYEQGWSVNPTWVADFREFPNHPITRGVRPFKINDEWYYHMRFRDEMKGVTPILSARPPDSTRKGPDGPHSGNPTVRSRLGMPSTWPGPPSVRMAAAASGSPARTSIGTGRTTTCGSSCSTLSCGLPARKCRRTACLRRRRPSTISSPARRASRRRTGSPTSSSA